jgi:hypothetical protein
MKRGPKTDPRLEQLSRRTVVLDEPTVAKARALGKNLSDGIRNAVRTAYRIYQSTRDDKA